jgi:hypothetical protein
LKDVFFFPSMLALFMEYKIKLSKEVRKGERQTRF